MSHAAEKFVEQGSNGGFAVGAGYAYEFELFCRVAVESCCNLACDSLAVCYFYIITLFHLFLFYHKNRYERKYYLRSAFNRPCV